MPAAARALMNPLVGILLSVVGALGLLLWSQQQELLRDMSGRIAQLETRCDPQ